MRRLFVIGPGDRLLEAAAWPSPRGISLVLAPRPEYEVLLVDVPPVRGGRLDAALPWRVRPLYPGPTERTVLDHRPVPGEPRERLVFVMDREALHVLRAAAGKRPLVAPCLLLGAAPMRGPWIGILWTSVWAEVVCLDGRTVLGSRLLRRDAVGNGDLACTFALTLSEAPAGAPIVVAYTRDAGSELKGLSSALDAVLHGRSLRVVPLEEFVPRPAPEACAVFRERKARSEDGARKIFLALAVPATIFTASVPARLARVREAELSLAKAEYATAKAQYDQAIERAEEADRLSARRDELEARVRPDAYRLLADIASGAGSGIRVRSLVLEDGSFRIEAEGSDGLTVLKRMRDSGLFDSVELRQSVTEPSGGERYTLSGRPRR